MTDHQNTDFSEIGERLRAHRLGNGLSPQQLSSKLGISRAALYRAEKGEIRKIDMLTAIANELGVSLANLMGVGVEYVGTAIGFFERMRQLEERCEQIIGQFSPISYLLTSDAYDDMLREVLIESVPDDPDGSNARTVEALMALLRARKETFQRRRPLIVSLISSADLERFLLHGLAGRHDLPDRLTQARRRAARQEAENIIALLEDQPIGVQVGIAREPVPATSFQIFRQASRPTLAISPFRLGEQPNVRLGVALVTAAHEAVALHEDIAARLWHSALKSADAAAYLRDAIDRYAIDE